MNEALFSVGLFGLCQRFLWHLLSKFLFFFLRTSQSVSETNGDLFFLVLCLLGLCRRTAAVHPLGQISWLTLTNTRSWPTTVACCRSTTTRATSKVALLLEDSEKGSLSSIINQTNVCPDLILKVSLLSWKLQRCFYSFSF